MSGRRHAGIRGRGRRRQRLHGEQSTHVGRQQHDHLDQGQPHVQLRRELPPVVAPARPGHRPPRRTSGISTFGFTGNTVADFLLGYYARRQRLPARAFHRRGRGGQPLRVQLDVLRPVHPGRLEGQLQAHPEPGPPLRLPQRALRDERPHGLAEPRLRPGRPARGRPEPGERGNRRRRLLPGSRATQPREPRPVQGLRSPDQLRLPSRPSPGRRSSGAATGSSTTPPSCARSTAPRTSIPYVSRGQLHADPQPDDAAADDRPAVPELHRAAEWRRPQPTPSSP